MYDPTKVDTRRLADLELDLASGAWGFAFLIQAIMVFLSLYFVFTGGGYLWAPVVTALMAVASAITRWLSDQHKTASEGLRRLIEEHDCLGWSISGPLRDDLIASTTPSAVLKAVDPDHVDPCYAATPAPPPEQVAEMVQQSAWWSKRLSGELGYLTAGFAAVTGSVAFVALLAALQDLSQDTSGAAPKLATSIVVLISCSGVMRLAADHYAFSAAALRMQTLAAHLREQGALGRVSAIRLLHQYQALRQEAPLVPSFWLQARRDGLRREWVHERRRLREPEALGH